MGRTNTQLEAVTTLTFKELSNRISWVLALEDVLKDHRSIKLEYWLFLIES